MGESWRDDPSWLELQELPPRETRPRLRIVDGAQPQSAQPASQATTGGAATIADVLADWRQAGPLVHEPTGLATLDRLTGGGPVYGTRWYLSGAPDAGKTALLVMIAHTFAARGVAVGLLAVDEEAGDLVTRLAQRIGYARHHCETRDPKVLAEIGAELGELPLRIYDDAWTIESAATDLAAWGRERAVADPERHPHGPQAILGIDSVQTVTCDAERHAERELGMAEAVTQRVRAIRRVATAHQLIVLAASELGRASYASPDPGQRTTALAGSKWSGAIEYSARVLASLRSVAGQSDLLELELAKNKHGPRTTADGEHGHVYLRIDRRSQTLAEVNYDPPPVDREAQRDEHKRARVEADAETVMRIVTAQPGIGTRDLISTAAGSGLSRERVYAAIPALGSRIERRPGKRDAKHHYPAGAP